MIIIHDYNWGHEGMGHIQWGHSKTAYYASEMIKTCKTNGLLCLRKIKNNKKLLCFGKYKRMEKHDASENKTKICLTIYIYI
jgi:hypothetical protein